jgi:serine/threonine-protein kinase
MIGHLLIIAGPDTGRSFPVEEGQTLVIGRGHDTGTRLTDMQASRSHCRLEFAGKTLRVVDSGSASGTLVNGQRVTEQVIHPGDVIQVGTTQLRYQSATAFDQSTVMLGDRGSGDNPAIGDDPSAELSGKTVSHFEVGEVLAHGQNGTVYKARDTDDGRTVALKVPAGTVSRSEEQLQRFVRTMKTIIDLKHPNIVEVYSAGKSGTICWVAMEYIEGESIAKVIKRIGTLGMLDWRFALTAAVHVGRALQAASEQNIIHRNVTPTNILVRKSDNVAKLGDLMFAKALEGKLARQITRPGQLMGEIAYMAPERTQEGVAVDTRSDIYGLGATVYALLTGRPPFAGTSLAETIAMIRSSEPVRPKKYQLAVPDLFEGSVLRMLAKRPEDRFQTPRALLDDLDRVAKFNGVTV